MAKGLIFLFTVGLLCGSGALSIAISLLTIPTLVL